MAVDQVLQSLQDTSGPTYAKPREKLSLLKIQMGMAVQQFERFLSAGGGSE